MYDLQKGDRVAFVRSSDEYTRLTRGELGTVSRVSNDPFDDGEIVIDVNWDSSSRLSMLTAAQDVVHKVDA